MNHRKSLYHIIFQYLLQQRNYNKTHKFNENCKNIFEKISNCLNIPNMGWRTELSILAHIIRLRTLRCNLCISRDKLRAQHYIQRSVCDYSLRLRCVKILSIDRILSIEIFPIRGNHAQNTLSQFFTQCATNVPIINTKISFNT